MNEIEKICRITDRIGKKHNEYFLIILKGLILSLLQLSLNKNSKNKKPLEQSDLKTQFSTKILWEKFNNYSLAQK